jgi:CheY-like chemotaxis protein
MTKPGLETFFSGFAALRKSAAAVSNKGGFETLEIMNFFFSIVFAVETSGKTKSMSAAIDRILIVDDEPQFVKTLQRHLRREGFRLCAASDGKMARKQIESFIAEGKPVDLVITDVLMPRMDGIELMQWIRDWHPEISVIAVSGFADSIASEKMIRPDMDEYCRKPFTPGELMSLLKKIGEKRRNIRPLECETQF